MHRIPFTGGLVAEIMEGSHWRSHVEPTPTGYAAQQVSDTQYSAMMIRDAYEPGPASYADHTPDYEPPEPWHESVVGSTLRLHGPTPDEPEPLLPRYEDALMDQWLTDRAMDQILADSPGRMSINDRIDACVPLIRGALDAGGQPPLTGEAVEAQPGELHQVVPLENVVDEEWPELMGPFGAPGSSPGPMG